MYKSLGRDVSGWLLMIPSLILFMFFVFEPLFESVRLSLYSAQGMKLLDFVGLQNYVDVLNHPDFSAALRNTFLYTFWSLIIGFIIPIIIAVLISETTRFQSFFRLTSYFPNIIPGLAIVLMWGFLMKPGKTGVLNIISSHFGADPFAWLSNSSLVIPLIVLTMTWKSAGATALIYMAAIGGISAELYEAATIDGAGIWKRFKHVTLPQIYNLARTLLILQIISVFQILYEPLVLTNGGPNNASISIMQLVYKYAFEKFDYPHAAAVSVIICIILMFITVIYNKVNKKMDM